MIHPIILSDTNPKGSREVFNNWLHNEPVTLLVVLGADHEATLALEKVNDKINSGSKEYASVRAIHATNPDHIKKILEHLQLKPGQDPVNWNQMSSYVLLSISNQYYNIGKVITKAEFPSGPDGYINLAVLYAQAADEDLSQ